MLLPQVELIAVLAVKALNLAEFVESSVQARLADPSIWFDNHFLECTLVMRSTTTYHEGIPRTSPVLKETILWGLLNTHSFE